MIVPSAPRSRQQKGRPGILDQGRQLFWSWWLWTLAALVTQYAGHRRMAIAMTVAAVITYLVAPREHSPKYGLESRFPVSSSDFLDSMVGCTGMPYLP